MCRRHIPALWVFVFHTFFFSLGVCHTSRPEETQPSLPRRRTPLGHTPLSRTLSSLGQWELPPSEDIKSSPLLPDLATLILRHSIVVSRGST